MKILNQKDLYLKGTCVVTVKRPHDGQIVFKSNKVATNNFQTELDMGPIRAGLGNPIAIQIPHNAGVNLDLTTADFSMQAIAMQTGGSVRYNAIGMVCAAVSVDLGAILPRFFVDFNTMELTEEYPKDYEGSAFFIADGCLYVSDEIGEDTATYTLDPETMELTAEVTSASLIVPDAEPIANYGDKEPYCYINHANATDLGKAYLIGPNGRIKDFIAIPGKVYNVTYYERNASAQELEIPALFSPGVYTVTAKMAVFSADGKHLAKYGTQIGWAYYHIPRMQFAGNANVNGSQTENSGSALNGTALSYADAAKAGDCIDCTFPTLAYMAYEPIAFNANNAIAALAVIGGDVYMYAGNGGKKNIPVKYIMTDGSVIQPKYSDLAFEIEDEGIATVEDGVITGLSSGETYMTVRLKNGSVNAITVGVYVS